MRIYIPAIMAIAALHALASIAFSQAFLVSVHNTTYEAYTLQTPYESVSVSPLSRVSISAYDLAHGCTVTSQQDTSQIWKIAVTNTIGQDILRYTVQHAHHIQRPSDISVTMPGENTLTIATDGITLVPHAIEAPFVLKYISGHDDKSASTGGSVEASSLIPRFRKGELSTMQHQSMQLVPGKTLDRPFNIYLPPEYFENTNQTFPILYYLHGFPENQNSVSRIVSFMAEILINAGRMQPMIIVFPNGNAPVDSFVGVTSFPTTQSIASSVIVDTNELSCAYVDSDPANGGIGQWQTYFIQELIPHVESTFASRLMADQSTRQPFRGIAGFSMGGGAHRVALPRSDVFGSLSTSSGALLEYSRDFDVLEKMDEIVLQLQNDVGALTSKHLAEFDPSNPSLISPSLVGLNPQLGILYNISRAFAPNASNPFLVDFPLDNDGNRNPVAVTKWNQHASTLLAQSNVADIKKNDMKIFFDAGGKDFFYDLAALIDRPNAGLMIERHLSDLETLGKSMYMQWEGTYSDTLTNLGIDHDFIVYQGGHNNVILHQVMSELIFHSAAFSRDQQIDYKRNRIVGNGSISLQDDAQLIIDKEHAVGIETDPIHGITQTDVAVTASENAQIHVGDSDNAGGILQIGNPFSRVDFINTPTLHNHTIDASIILAGNSRMCIGNQGMFGIGVGFEGQTQTSFPDFVSSRTLTSVDTFTLSLQEQSSFDHNSIAPGDDPAAGLLAIGPGNTYNLQAQSDQVKLHGGGNIIWSDETLLSHPAQPHIHLEKEADPLEVEFFPKIQLNAIPQILGEDARVADTMYQGIISVQQRQTEYIQLTTGVFDTLISGTGEVLIDPFIEVPGGSTQLTIPASRGHKNMLENGIVGSHPLVIDENTPPFNRSVSQNDAFHFLKTKPHFENTSPKANVKRINGQLLAAYLINRDMEVARTKNFVRLTEPEDIMAKNAVIVRNPVRILLQPPFASSGNMYKAEQDGAVANTIDTDGNLISAVVLP